MKKVDVKTVDKIGELIDELEILIYFSHLVSLDSDYKHILENEFEFTHKYAPNFLNDLLRENLIKFKNAYSEI